MKPQNIKLLSQLSSEDLEKIIRKTMEIFSTYGSDNFLQKRPETTFMCILDENLENFVDTALLKPAKTQYRDLNIETKKDSLAINIVKKTRHKPAKKRQKLLFYRSEIKRLRQKEGMSWREIANYLAIRHKFKVNYSTIAKFMKTQGECND